MLGALRNASAVLRGARSHIRPSAARPVGVATATVIVMLIAGCAGGLAKPVASSSRGSTPHTTQSPSHVPSRPAAPGKPAGEFTISFAGDINFMDRTLARLQANPATVFGPAAAVLSAADITMVNLETAITTGGDPQGKEFVFRAPPIALAALKDAGIDVATEANNHGADYGASGLADTLAAIKASGFPVIGIGANETQAFAPYTRTVNGAKVAIIAADQVQDETTLRLFSAGPHSTGVANAFSPLLLGAVRAMRARGYIVVVYLHWGTEYTTCPNDDQRTLAAQLAQAGAAAVIGTHVHVLQGAGWRADGTYVAYGLGNYLWWRSFGNDQDDNGVLTLTFRGGKVVADRFQPSRLDDNGVPVPATGAERDRIAAAWADVRHCAGLSAAPPR